jgi:hypothetical protein
MITTIPGQPYIALEKPKESQVETLDETNQKLKLAAQELFDPTNLPSQLSHSIPLEQRKIEHKDDEEKVEPTLLQSIGDDDGVKIRNLLANLEFSCPKPINNHNDLLENFNELDEVLEDLDQEIDDLNDILKKFTIANDNIDTVLEYLEAIFGHFCSQLPRLLRISNNPHSMPGFLNQGSLDVITPCVGETLGLIKKQIKNMNLKQKTECSRIINQFTSSINLNAEDFLMIPPYESPDSSGVDAMVSLLYKSCAMVEFEELNSYLKNKPK